MKQTITLLFLLPIFSSVMLNAQFVKFSPNADTSHQAQITLEGYIDTYFAFDFNQPKDANRQYFVSHSRQNEFNINLAYLSLKYSSKKVRATLTPGFGTYMNANYAAERVTLRNLVEANVGVKLARNKNIWLDAGVISSPYTNETAISLDQLTLSRSFAPEYVPYYLTGAKLSLPLSKKVTAYFYYINGWQVIEDVNTPLSGGTQLEFKPNDQLTLNWNTYFGNENAANAPDYGMRYFTDVFAIWNPSDRINFTTCAYAGWQERNGQPGSPWWQANAAVRVYLKDQHSISARIEYFEDKESVFIAPVTGVSGFDCSSVSLGYNLALTKQAAFRLEGRYFKSGRDVFLNDALQAADHNFTIMGGLTARF